MSLDVGTSQRTKLHYEYRQNVLREAQYVQIIFLNVEIMSKVTKIPALVLSGTAVRTREVISATV